MSIELTSQPAYSLVSSGGLLANTSTRDDPRFQKLESMVENSVRMSRELYTQLMDPRRNIDTECGYPTPQNERSGQLTPKQWSELHDFDPVANRINSLMADEAFKSKFEVYEDDDEEVITTFEEAVDNLQNQLVQEPSHYNDEQGSMINDHLKRAWVEAGKSRFGVLLFGFNDAKGPNVQTALEKEVPFRVNSKLKLTYLRSFPEHLAQIAAWESDPNSPRVGQPTYYNLTFGDISSPEVAQDTTIPIQTMRVHWTRVLHICRNPGTHPYVGNPECQSIIKPICNLQKITGADGEGRWKMAFTSLSFESVPGFEHYDENQVKDVIEQFEQGLQRSFGLVGFKVNSIAPSMIDPTPGVEINLRLIALNKRIPKRILEGSERGELASSGDRIEWQEEVREYCSTSLNPRLIVPFYNRLINVGVLPVPKQGFKVRWPDIAALSQKEQLENGKLFVEVLTTYAQGGAVDLLPPMDLYTRILGLSQTEAGAITDALLERAEEDGGETTRNPLLSTVGGATAIIDLFKAGSEGALNVDQLKGVLKLLFSLDNKTIDSMVGDKLEKKPVPAIGAKPGQPGAKPPVAKVPTNGVVK